MKRDRPTRAGALGLRGFPVRPAVDAPSASGRGLLATTLILVGFGLLSVYSASSYVAQQAGRPDTYYLFQQASRAGIGCLAMAAASRVPRAMPGMIRCLNHSHSPSLSWA